MIAFGRYVSLYYVSRQYTMTYLLLLMITLSTIAGAYDCLLGTCMSRPHDIHLPMYGGTWHGLTHAHSPGTLSAINAVAFNRESSEHDRLQQIAKEE